VVLTRTPPDAQDIDPRAMAAAVVTCRMVCRMVSP
jgi:hypothetical protein